MWGIQGEGSEVYLVGLDQGCLRLFFGKDRYVVSKHGEDELA